MRAGLFLEHLPFSFDKIGISGFGQPLGILKSEEAYAGPRPPCCFVAFPTRILILGMMAH